MELDLVATKLIAQIVQEYVYELEDAVFDALKLHCFNQLSFSLFFSDVDLIFDDCMIYRLKPLESHEVNHSMCGMINIGWNF